MAILTEDGIQYCLETPPSEDDGDNTNKPSGVGIIDATLIVTNGLPLLD